MSKPGQKKVRGDQFNAGFKLGRMLRDPKFREVLRTAAGYEPGMVLDARDVLDAVRPDGAGGWKVVRKLVPIRWTSPDNIGCGCRTD